MDMLEALRKARAAVGDTTGAFDTRRVFGRREGKQIVFPVGLGSALGKAVREGYLRVVGDGARRRGRKYAFTQEGLALVRQTGSTQGAKSA